MKSFKQFLTEADSSMQPEMVPGGTVSTGYVPPAPRNNAGTITPERKPGEGLNVVSFNTWMFNRFGLDWQQNITGLALELYKAFFERFPNGTPPSNWSTHQFTAQEFANELQRLKLGQHNLPRLPNNVDVGFDKGPMGWAFDAEGDLGMGIMDWLGRLG